MRVSWRTFKVLQHGALMAYFQKDDYHTNALKKDSAVVAAEEVICERINTGSTNIFKIMQWRVQKLKWGLMKVVYVSVRQWKLLLDLNKAGWKLQWGGREKICTLCGFVRNVFGECLTGERKLPGFEANRCEYIWSCNRKGPPKVTKTKRLLSAILVHLTEAFHLGPFLLSTTVTPNG